ncbi:MAG: DUF881 domain-containing protein [Oscillospiraceae bacterium]|nr:DUF881 domain-containing protein [Oscillospiraceae bacterium]
MKLKSQIVIGIILLLLGFLLTNSIKTLISSSEGDASTNNKDLQAYISSLETLNANLKEKNKTLQADIDKLNSENAQGNSGLSDLLNKIHNYENIIGLNEVQGAGISLIVKPLKNPLGQVQSNLDSNDLVIIVNELWHSNAEAISVQGTRLTFMTSIFSSGDFIVINDDTTRISASSEIKIEAIGDPDKLYASMKMPGLFQNIATKLIIDGPYKENNLILKGYDGALDYEYLKPVEAKE